MCGAGGGNNKSSGGNGNKNKPAGPKKVVKPVNNVGYQARATANKSTNIPILSTVIKDKYRNDDVSYNQAYWATTQAEMKAEQDSIGMKKSYSGDRVPTRFPNTGPPSQGFKEGTASVITTAPKNKIAVTVGQSSGGSGGSNQDTALAGGAAATATNQPDNLKNMLAIKKNAQRQGKRKLRQKRNTSVGFGNGGVGLNITT